MQRSGFFNAILNNGEYDRKYNANDYADNLAVIISNGVLRSENDDLRVTAAGMVVSVGVGRAWIEGHYFINDTPHAFSAITAPVGGARYDRILLRLDKNLAVRSVSLVYQQGEASNNPTKPEPVRTGNIYDIVLADVYVASGATSVVVTDTRADTDVCGWVYSTSGDNSFFESMDVAFNEWFSEKKDTLTSTSLFKRYNWRSILTNATNLITFNIPQYNEETCFIEVFINGIVATEGADYTVTASNITFGNSLVAGTEIEVKCYKSLDGTGIMSVADEITELQNALAALNKTGEYEYICNGVDDNVKLSEIAQAYLDGGEDYGSRKINVVGTFGAQAPFAGSGSSASFFRWLSIGGQTAKNRKLIFDFTNCSQIELPIEAGTLNTVFFGVNAHVIGANVIANQTGNGTVIQMFSSGSNVVPIAENCRFWISGNNSSYIARSGTFKNCRVSVTNITGNSYCYFPNTYSLLRVIGGEYYAYVGNTTGKSAVTYQESTNAVTILYGVNAPSVARSGYYQTNSVIQVTGGGTVNCTDLISILPLSVISGASNIRGTIIQSKAGLL